MKMVHWVGVCLGRMSTALGVAVRVRNPHLHLGCENFEYTTGQNPKISHILDQLHQRLFFFLRRITAVLRCPGAHFTPSPLLGLIYHTRGPCEEI